MKKKILTLAAIALFMAGFTSCNNEDIDECFVENTAATKIVETRSSVPMTMEEALARLQALNEKYNCNFVMVKPAELHDEHHFAILENVMRSLAGLEPLPIEVKPQLYKTQLMDDTSIDEINVASTVTTLENDNENVQYTARGSSYETVEGADYAPLGTQFYRYNYEIFYRYAYGVHSDLEFDGFENQTNYSYSNMPQNESNASLSQDEIDKIAKDYVPEYVQNSLLLGSVIYYDNNNPEDLEQVFFSYSYQFTLHGIKFIAVCNSQGGALDISIIQ